MLKKLLKYDIKSVWKLWAALSVGVLGMVIITSFIIRGAIEANLSDSESILTIFLILGSAFMAFGVIMIWSAILTITPIMCYIRYYKNFFSDEGYLTFTLPVRRRDLYLSKVINVFLFDVGNIVVSCVAVAIAMLIIPGIEYDMVSSTINFAAYEALGELFALIWEGLGAWIFIYAVLGVVLLALLSVYQIGMIHLCITVGATVAKKHKVLAGIGIYFGTTFILSSVYQLFSFFGAESIAGFILLLSDASSEITVHISIIVLLLLIAVIVATASLILHLITLDTIERKLNLA